jgi:hypothetical protein
MLIKPGSITLHASLSVDRTSENEETTESDIFTGSPLRYPGNKPIKII